MKTAALFSGGKDSVFSIQQEIHRKGMDLLISFTSPAGETQLHAGPEGDAELRILQLTSLELPYEEFPVSQSKDYLRSLFLGLNKVIKDEDIARLVTGDLWHPYTFGIGDMLAGALGVELVRPAREICSARDKDRLYMGVLLDSGIQAQIISVRSTDLDKAYVGRIIDHQLISELASLGVDVAAEGGEYQSVVLDAPIMKQRIVIEDYCVELVDGKNGREQFYRMKIGGVRAEQK